MTPEKIKLWCKNRHITFSLEDEIPRTLYEGIVKDLDPYVKIFKATYRPRTDFPEINLQLKQYADDPDLCKPYLAILTSEIKAESNGKRQTSQWAMGSSPEAAIFGFINKIKVMR